MNDDYKFFTTNLGYSWLEQIKNYLIRNYLGDVKNLKIIFTLSGLQKDKINLVVSGKFIKDDTNYNFITKFKLSEQWQIPGESVFELCEVNYESESK